MTPQSIRAASRSRGPERALALSCVGEWRERSVHSWLGYCRAQLPGASCGRHASRSGAGSADRLDVAGSMGSCGEVKMATRLAGYQGGTMVQVNQVNQPGPAQRLAARLLPVLLGLGLLLGGCGTDTLVSTSDAAADAAAEGDGSAADQLASADLADGAHAEDSPDSSDNADNADNPDQTGDPDQAGDAAQLDDADAAPLEDVLVDAAEPDAADAVPDAPVQTDADGGTQPVDTATDGNTADSGATAADAGQSDASAPDNQDIQAAETSGNEPDAVAPDVAETDAVASADATDADTAALDVAVDSAVDAADSSAGADVSAEPDTASQDAPAKDTPDQDTPENDTLLGDGAAPDTAAQDTQTDIVTGDDAAVMDSAPQDTDPQDTAPNDTATAETVDLDAVNDGASPDTPDSADSPDSADATHADAAGSDAASGPIACASNSACTGSGQVCDPLAKVCVDCLWDSDCGPGAVCDERVCQPVTTCSNSLGCTSAVDATGQALPICDKDAGRCVACLSNLDCAESQVCSDQKCVAVVACQNSKDCSPDQVCDTQKGYCKDCLGDADCGSSQQCMDGECIDFIACSSDKQCTPLGLLCDTSKGKCAGCLVHSDCPAVYHCAPTGVGGTGQCELDVCQSGEAKCDANQVVVCNATGDDWALQQACGSASTCVQEAGSAACLPWVCQPGSGCQDGKAIVCSSDGLSITQSTDCAIGGGVCSGGQCKTLVCEPGTSWCSGQTRKVCSADGLSIASATLCQQGTWCDSGTCKTQICSPNANICAGQVAKTCDSTGLAYVGPGTDCSSQNALCQAGTCKPILCTPASQFCSEGKLVTCGADGTSIASMIDCQPGSWCSSGSCQPQICTPAATSCAGSVVKTCDATGLAYEAGGTDCATQNAVCKAGGCVTKICTPLATFCDGNQLQTCSSDGTAVASSQACDSNSYCGPSGGQAACLPKVCADSAPVCSGTTATVCKADGSGYAAGGTDCAATGKVCIQGACVACTISGAETCDGQDNDCDGNTDEDDGTPLCSNATICQAKACVNGSCVATNAAAGTPCDDATSCLAGRACNGAGSCTGGKDRFFDRTYVPADQASSSVSAAAPLGDGGYVVLGRVGVGPSGVGRIARNGDVQWQVALPSPGYGVGIHTDGDDGIYVNMPLGVVKLGLDGSVLWTYPLPRRGAVLGLAEGGVYVLVRTESAKLCQSCPIDGTRCVNDGGDELSLVKLGADGLVVAQHTVPGMLGTAKAAHDPMQMMRTTSGDLLAALTYKTACGFADYTSVALISPDGKVLNSNLSTIAYSANAVGMVDGKYVVANNSSSAVLASDLTVVSTSYFQSARFAYGPDGDWYRAERSTVAGTGGPFGVITLSRLSPSGATRWTRTFDQSASSKSMYVGQMVVGVDGMAIVGWISNGTNDASWVVSVDTWGHTSCAASGDCWTTPIGTCASCVAETCDGTDNDCSGQTDEAGATPLCEDGNACTAQSCASGQCFTAGLDGYLCNDGNVCTENDVCQGTSCQPGSVKNCNDDNPCTLDVCSPSAGCGHVPVPGSCP